MTPDINFKYIIPRGGSQTRAFEELCAQLARKTLNKGEEFERYHGDGGDGGVECIAKSYDQSIIGWQSKFVTNVEDLIRQASLSLETAVRIHPTLKKYILCFPFDLTGRTGRKSKTGEPAQSRTDKLNNWIKQSISKYKAQGALLEDIEVWPANRLITLMLQYDISAGIQTYFFSDTSVPLAWVEKNIEIGIKKAGPRYNPALSVETSVWNSFAAFGQTDSWNTVVSEQLEKVKNELKNFKENASRQSNDPVFPNLQPKLREQALAICEIIENTIVTLSGSFTDQALETIKEHIVESIQLLAELEAQQIDELNIQHKGDIWDNKQWRSFMAEYMVSFPAANLDHTRDMSKSLQALLSFVKSAYLKLASAKVFVLSGIGGSGKTHCICDVSAQRLEGNLLSCIIFGDQFSGNPDEFTRFSEALGLKNMSNDQLLDALNAAGEQTGKPFVIFFDAINETIPRSYWTNRIIAFADEIAKRPFLKLCISCRSSFLQVCLPQPHNFIIIEHTGFKGVESEACKAFFTFYRLNPPLIPILQPELSNPLYLKLVCAVLQDKGLKDLPAGWIGLFPVIKVFLQEKEKQFCRQYDLSPSGSIVASALTTVVQEISNKIEGSLSWTDATNAIAKNTPPIAAHFVLDWLVKADLLIEDGAFNNSQLASETYVRPAFERLGDFLIATEIVTKAWKTNGAFFLTHGKMQDIFKDETSINFNSSLVAALSVILPETHSVELPLLFETSPLYTHIAVIATRALIWRTPESLNNSTKKFVRQCLQNDGYTGMDALFSICANKSSLDAVSLNQLLKTSDLPDRDAFFVPYLYTRYNEQGIFTRLIKASEDIDLLALKVETAFRWLLALIWLTASPDRRIKDTATRAAVAILRHHTYLADELLEELLLVNDEEVQERLLLIIYASQLLHPDKETLTRISNNLVQKYSAVPSAFENALVRDHIRCIAELAKHLKCLPDSVDPLTSNKVDLKEGWSLDLPEASLMSAWKEEKGATGRVVNSALSDDFNHYSIGCLGDWMNSLNKMDIGNWIVNDVIERKGLDNELHSAYDISIVQETGGGRSKPTYAERIGKKYQWNSLYRLASILHDKVERKASYSKPEPERQPLILQEERKIDPTLTQPFTNTESNSKNWWILEKADLNASEKLSSQEWLDFDADIPQLSNIVSSIPLNSQNWIPISAYLSFNSKKRNDEYWSSYRALTMYIDAFLVKNVDLEHITTKLNGKNLHNEGLPSGGKFSHCYMGEYPWGTACNTNPDWYLGVEDTFGNSKMEMHNATNEIVAEWEYDATLKENIYIQVPSKRFFTPGDLWWNGKDGYKRLDGKTVFKDPRFETGGKLGLIADVDDLIVRLKHLNCNMVWSLRGEKLLVNHGEKSRDRKYFSQICWMDQNGDLHFGKRMFFASYDSRKGRAETIGNSENVPSIKK